MKEIYNTTIEHRGKLYRYDPDFDCFYPVQTPTTWDRWGWIAVILVLAIVAIAVS